MRCQPFGRNPIKAAKALMCDDYIKNIFKYSVARIDVNKIPNWLYPNSLAIEYIRYVDSEIRSALCMI